MHSQDFLLDLVMEVNKQALRSHNFNLIYTSCTFFVDYICSRNIRGISCSSDGVFDTFLEIPLWNHSVLVCWGDAFGSFGLPDSELETFDSVCCDAHIFADSFLSVRHPLYL